MNDQELRECFAELRAYERATAPAFEPAPLMLLRPNAAARGPRVQTSEAPLPSRRKPRAWRLAGASTALVAAAAVVILLLTRDAQEAEMSITDWVAPTDVLLQMPGTEWLGEMPTLTSEELP